MRLIKRWNPLLVLFLLSFSVSAVPLVAQTATPNPLESITLPAGSRDDHVLYYRPDTHPQDLDDARIVIYALDRAINVYQPLFDSSASSVPFQIVVHLTGLANPGIIADTNWMSSGSSQVTALTGVTPPATPLESDVCFVQVFLGIEDADVTTGKSTNADLDFAHEIAHCYQFFYITKTLASTPLKWWVEGGANWLATLVYPEQAPPANAANFDYRQDVLLNDYGNYFFWQYLASPQGLGSDQAAVAFMKTIPDDTAEHATLLDSLKGDGSGTQFFHEWATAIIGGTMTYPAPVEPADFNSINTSAPGSTQLRNPRFSAEFTRFQGFTVDQGNQAFVRISGTAAHNYQVSIQNGASIVQLTPDQDYLFCPATDGIILIQSRGNGAAADTSPYTVTWGQASSENPCDDSQDDTTAACMVGSWVVTSYPSTMLPFEDVAVDTSGFIFTFAFDRTFSGTYIVSAGDDTVGVSINVPFTGHYEVTSNEGSTEYDVHSFDWTFEPGGSMSVDAGGTITDMTTAFYRNSNTESWLPAGTLTCDETTLSWDTSDGSGSFVLTHLPEA